MQMLIVPDPELWRGRARVRDTRIAVAQLLECLAAGMSIAGIVDACPSLTDEAVRGELAELVGVQGQAAV